MTLTTTRPSGGYAVLSADELAKALPSLPGWRFDGGRLLRTVEGAEVWTLLERVSEVERELDHHSVVTLERGRLTFSVWTHVRPGLTAVDLALARRIDQLLS
jgi:4a-hydroxytetrahydrobiopterin dehydratase